MGGTRSLFSTQGTHILLVPVSPPSCRLHWLSHRGTHILCRYLRRRPCRLHWLSHHVLAWQQRQGPIPSGRNVVIVDRLPAEPPAVSTEGPGQQQRWWKPRWCWCSPSPAAGHAANVGRLRQHRACENGQHRSSTDAAATVSWFGGGSAPSTSAPTSSATAAAAAAAGHSRRPIECICQHLHAVHNDAGSGHIGGIASPTHGPALPRRPVLR